jgi:oligoendopeptidase F
MSQPTDRTQLDQAFKFDLESLFANAEVCEQRMIDARAVLAGLNELDANPASSAANLHSWLVRSAEAEILINQIYLYAFLRHEVDRNDQEATGLLSQALELVRQHQTISDPLNASLAAMLEEEFQTLAATEPLLNAWDQDYKTRRRRAAHRAAPEVAGAVAELETIAVRAEELDQILVSELRFDSIVDADGTPVNVTLDNLRELYRNPNAEVRQAAHRSYLSARHQHRRSSTAFWHQFMQARVAKARLRGYTSNLEEAFDEANIAPEVFFATLEACARHRPVWDRYWSARRELLGLPKMTTADFGLSLEAREPVVSYEQAVAWIVASVQGLGQDYAGILQEGLTTERWVDVYPTQGKIRGEFCWTTDGCKPYILVSFRDDFASLSALAHESGHAMHSYFTHATQPHQYANYGRTAAETAANVHQALLFSYLRTQSPDPLLRCAALHAELKVCKSYLMQMPINATFEHQVSTKVWAGEHLEADVLCQEYLELARAVNGAALEMSELDAVEWLDESALYMNYGALQYTLGIVGAQSIAERILRHEPGVVEGYRKFLTVGNSMDQLESLGLAGVDFSSGLAVDQAFQRVAELVTEMESLRGQSLTVH